MKGAILQPTYLPWLGYFEMIDATDVFVVFDHVQFAKKSWQHRNRIKTADGECMLTIPVAKAAQQTPISKIEIAESARGVLRDHWKTIAHTYKKARFFADYAERLEPAFQKPYVRLEDATTDLIRLLCDLLGIQVWCVFSSQLPLGVEPDGMTERVVHLCRAAGITDLYDARGAQSLLERAPFDAAGVRVTFQDFEHPVYSQLFGAFLPYLSVLDLLFNEGPRSLEIIRSGRRAPIPL